VTNTPASWLLKEPDEPAANLAAHVVEQSDLVWPVPIEALLAKVARIEDHAWPHQCDALVVGLLSDRPTVFIRSGLHPRRRRFTLAHEYGHVIMGWHIGEVGCNPTVGELEVEPLRTANSPSDLLAHRRLKEQEAEATRFASYLLMPERIIRPLVSQSDMAKVLEEAHQANVSTQAILMRIKGMLQPGFVFLCDERVYVSPGTVLPLIDDSGRIIDRKVLASAAIEGGEVVLSQRKVSWFQLSEFDVFRPVAGDDRRSSEILRDLLSRVFSDPTQAATAFSSINGVAGGSLSKDRATTAGQVVSILRHKFSHSVYKAVTTHPDFDVYLRRKAEEWAAKRAALP